MSNQVMVAEASDIKAAVQFVEQCAVSKHDTGTFVCPLICEELLLRFLDAGCTEIRVSSGRVLLRYIEIRAKGERLDILGETGEKESNTIESQISSCLLEQYEDHFTFRYQNGVNVCRISIGKPDKLDLTEEIYAFYKDADPRDQAKPMSVLWHIARRHKFFSSFLYSSCF